MHKQRSPWRVDIRLVDLTKRLDPDGRIAQIGELLNQTNEILLDMPWKEGNLTTGERTVVRTGLPTVAWRLLNKGVASSKSTTDQIDEQCGKRVVDGRAHAGFLVDVESQVGNR